MECEYTDQYGGKTPAQLQPGSTGHASKSAAKFAVPPFLAPCPHYGWVSAMTQVLFGLLIHTKCSPSVPRNKCINLSSLYSYANFMYIK